MDVAKQVDYWKQGSEEDLVTARILMEKERWRHSLFFAHLAVEKALKAHVCVKTSQVPPKIHNLPQLAEKTGLPFDPEQRDFFLGFDIYQLEGRYPDIATTPIDRENAHDDLAEAEKVLKWLISRL